MKKFLFSITFLVCISACQTNIELTPSGAVVDDPSRSVNAPVFPPVIALLNGFAPEGITMGDGAIFYAGSLASGAVVQGDLRTGEVSLLITGQNQGPAVGMDYDPRSKCLFVAGGPTGNAFVYDTRDGSLKATYSLSIAGSNFINDVIVTREAAYFTNSFQPEFYRIPLGARGSLPDDADVETVSLTGDFVQVMGFNSNGIVASANGKMLIIANSSTGDLFLVNPATGSATAIDLGGASLPTADGMVLKGTNLYVVQNQLNQIAIVALAPGWASGSVVGTITDPNYDVPTTADIFGNTIYSVNARFGTPATPDTKYDVVGVPLP
jgi:hypothetical protein